MSITYSYGKEEISINENESMVIETKGEDGYKWKEVTYKSTQDEIFVGSYFTYNYSSSREWMEYNENYIALLAVYTFGYEISDTKVKKIFDINNKQLIDGSKEELLEIYNREFNKPNKKKILTQK